MFLLCGRLPQRSNLSRDDWRVIKIVFHDLLLHSVEQRSKSRDVSYTSVNKPELGIVKRYSNYLFNDKERFEDFYIKSDYPDTY